MSKDTKDYKDYFNEGKKWLESGEPEVALTSFSKAIALNPKHSESYYQRGITNDILDKFSCAIEDFTKVIDLNSDSKDISPVLRNSYYQRGLVKNYVKDYEGAMLDFLDASFSLNPNKDRHQLSLNFLGSGLACYGLKNYKDALSDFNKAISMNPNCVEGYLNRGRSELKLENFRYARRDFDKVVELDPSNAFAYIGRAICNSKFLNDGIGLSAAEIYRSEGFVLSNYEKALNLNKSFDRYADKIFTGVLKDLNPYKKTESLIFDKEGKEIQGTQNKSVKSIIIPNTIDGEPVRVISDFALGYLKSVSDVKIGDLVHTIGDFAFSTCENLTDLELGNSVMNIGAYAFGSCRKLPSLKLPNSVAIIEERAFFNCSSLTSLNIPNSVIKIGKCAFENCENLVVSVEQKDPTEIQLGYSAFGSISVGSSVKEIRVPQESLGAYKKAEGWKEYADRIKPIEKKQEQVQERRRGRGM